MNWIKVEDRLPEDARDVFAYNKMKNSEFYRIVCWFNGKWWYGGNHSKTIPTHWRELIAPEEVKEMTG